MGMNVIIAPGALQGSVAAPLSKSHLHRLLIAAALADAPTLIKLPGGSPLPEDIEATARCLCALGASIERREDALRVVPIGETPRAPFLHCGESGATLRFLLPVAMTLCERARFAGTGRLPLRPIGELREAMQAHGVSFDAPTLPFEACGYLRGGAYALRGDVSSQYVTGLLLALPRLRENGTLALTTPLVSAGYIESTLRVLHDFGVSVACEKNVYNIFGGQTYHTPCEVSVEGDWSSAAALLCAGALAGRVRVTGLDADSAQGDKAILMLLSRMGAAADCARGAAMAQPGTLRGCDVDISQTPDLLPVLAVTAAFAQGETRFYNAGRLRAKESDRLKSTAALISALGGAAVAGEDTLTVQGKPLTGGRVQSFSDHRIVMAAAVAAARCKGPVTILGAEAVNKSYPMFFQDYICLGGKVDVL